MFSLNRPDFRHGYSDFCSVRNPLIGRPGRAFCNEIATKQMSAGFRMVLARDNQLKGDVMVSAWGQLYSWNLAIRDVVYGFDKAGQSAYLDLDDDVIERILDHPALVGKTKADLFTDVLAILNLSAASDLVLESLRIRSREWILTVIASKNPDEVPPMLAFLAVTVAAAEEMGSGDLDSNAFYPHLCRLLSIEDSSTEANKLQISYRGLAEDLWSYLNRWLIDIGYRRGIPTAYAITQRFVGIPVSQALVRETDRKRLPAMFDFYGLNPERLISISEMEELVSLWILRDEHAVSAAVRRLWLDPQAREQICIAFCDELSKWDGQFESPQQSNTAPQARVIHSRKLLIGAWFSNQMGSKSLQLSLLAPVSFSVTESEWKLRHESGIEIEFSRLNESYFEAQALGSSTTQRIMNSMLELKDDEAQSFRREPTTVIALSFEENTQGFVETKRLAAGQNALLLVKDFKNLLVETKAFLDRNARPGYEALGPGTRGVPEGWWLFRNVQITEIDNQLSTPLEKEKFSALIPTGVPQLLVSGGVKLPGFRSLNQWLANSPPEMRALSQTVPSIKVVIEASDAIGGGSESIVELKSDVGAIFKNLGDLDLRPGNYLATLFEGTKPVLSRRFTLASGKEPDLLLKANADRLARDFANEGAKSLFSANKTESIEGVVLGAYSSFNSGAAAKESSFARTAGWGTDEDASFETTIDLLLAELSSNSCFYKGNHDWDVPGGFRPGAAPKSVIARCSSCNSLSVQNLSVKNAELAKLAKEKAANLAVRNLRSAALRSNSSPVVEQVEEFDWRQLRAILNYSVAGKFGNLLDTVKQLGESTYSAHEVLDFLDQLGYLEVQRDFQGRGVYWRLSPTQLIKTPGEEGGFYFLGATPESFLKEFMSVIRNCGESPTLDSSGVVVKIEGASDAALQKACIDLDVLFVNAQDAYVLEALPSMSAYSNEAAREVLPASDSISKFNLESGDWQEVEAMAPGAIRLKTKFGFRYFFVPSQAELKQGMGISCSATVSKYLMASAERLCLASYREETSTLYVPLGAKLPGLYARPTLLCAPQMPKKAKMSRKHDGSTYFMYKYTNVPKPIAQGLANLLAS